MNVGTDAAAETGGSWGRVAELCADDSQVAEQWEDDSLRVKCECLHQRRFTCLQKEDREMQPNDASLRKAEGSFFPRLRKECLGHGNEQQINF